MCLTHSDAANLSSHLRMFSHSALLSELLRQLLKFMQQFLQVVPLHFATNLVRQPTCQTLFQLLKTLGHFAAWLVGEVTKNLFPVSFPKALLFLLVSFFWAIFFLASVFKALFLFIVSKALLLFLMVTLFIMPLVVVLMVPAV